jgi:hypothetical protein
LPTYLRSLIIGWEEVAMSKKQRPYKKRRSRKLRPTYSEDGVDLTLIRWMLSLTPEERIKALENNLYALARLKNGKVAT